MEEGELIQKYGLNIEALKREQLKLAKELKIKDSAEFLGDLKIGAIDNLIINNKIISGIIVCDKDFNILEQQYALSSLKFPFLREFRSYREVPNMIEAINKLNDRPDIILVHGEGIIHPRLGIASHFSIFSNIPSIGVSDELFEINKLDGENKLDIIKEDKKVGKVLVSKIGSRPLYISPGNNISTDSAYHLCKKLIKEPHKLPEPLHLVHKYIKGVKEELGM